MTCTHKSQLYTFGRLFEELPASYFLGLPDPSIKNLLDPFPDLPAPSKGATIAFCQGGGNAGDRVEG